ncbi:hypothetical protein CCR85_06185 [Rhodothalassium salexigens]|uniref:arylesterase n=1 Tax=Rhodothalassium salexigens TaxID=1086 RepID=UPI0019118E99|nr:arylesterase [Rhodothalassium salexigens]MBK5911079.1 hypothetical protein [Rhodothalassium salexigens]MBK5920028.1 hypothetical protein [Rhodothalassium salexigens]
MKPLGLLALFATALAVGFAAPAADRPTGDSDGKDAGAATHTVLALGDSLTAGYGLGPGEGFTGQLAAWLDDRGLDTRVVNAGVSGDTTSGGRSRLAWVLDGLDRAPDLAIVALGGNDMLRAIEPKLTRANLAAIIATLKERDIPVLLAGMRAPPNRGPDYAQAFDAIYPDLAEQQGVRLYPFFMDGVATDTDLLQPDGLHPNAKGVARMVDGIGPLVAAMLRGDGAVDDNTTAGRH